MDRRTILKPAAAIPAVVVGGDMTLGESEQPLPLPKLRALEDGKLMTAGGLSSGIDAALGIVERYFGREIAQQTATYMEYQGRGWVS